MYKILLTVLATTRVVLAVPAPAPDDGKPLRYWCNTLNANDVDQTCYCSAFWTNSYASADIQFKNDRQLASFNSLFDGIENAIRAGRSEYTAPLEGEYNGWLTTHDVTIVLTPEEGRDWPTDYRLGTIRAFRRGSYERRQIDGGMRWFVRESTQYWKWTPDQCWTNTQCGFFKQCSFSEGGYLVVRVACSKRLSRIMATLGPSETPDGADAIARTAHVQSLLERLLRNSPIYGFTLSTIKLESVSKGLVTTTLTLAATHVNSKGGLHGAVSATIIDFTTGLAIASWDLRETTGASVDMHISYLSTAWVGDTVRIETRAERVGRNMSFVTVKIMRIEDGTVVTLGGHTKYVKGTAAVTAVAAN